MKKVTIDFRNVNEGIKPILGIITIIAVFSYLFGITFSDVKLAKDIVPQVLIAVVAFGKDIYNYFFGSSQGLAKANETIANNASNSTTQNVEEINTDAINVKK